MVSPDFPGFRSGFRQKPYGVPGFRADFVKNRMVSPDFLTMILSFIRSMPQRLIAGKPSKPKLGAFVKMVESTIQ